MNRNRCAFVAAVVAVVCTVAYLCWNRFGNEAEEVVASAATAPSVKVAGAVSSAVASGTRALLQFPSNQTATVRGTKPYVLTSEKSFQKSLRLVAESLGARTVCSLSRNSLMVEADPVSLARLAADGRFASVDEFLPSDKIDPDLMKMLAGGAKNVEVVVVTLTAEDRKEMLGRVVALGGEILTGCLNDGDNFRANIPAERIADFAGRGDVRWLEPFVRPRPTNDLAVEPAGMFVREAWNVHWLSGANQFVSTSDTGIDLEHPDLKGQVVGHAVATKECSETDSNGHGTHTAGSIVGDGTMSQVYEEGPILGSAWGAKLWAWFCDGGTKGILTPPTLDQLFQPDSTNAPAFIHSASWGSNLNGKYESQCVSTDTYVWKHPDFLPVYSAGNEGSGATTIGAPAAAKNVLTVGATQNVREGYFGGHDQYPLIPSGDPAQTASYSSRGPCQDGRIKPDIAAPGSGVLSTRSHGVEYGYGNYDEFYAYDCGTSMACPLTAGAVALVREWLTTEGGFEDVEGTRPTAALMKAVITGGAKDAVVPNNDQGWGRVDITETLFPSNRAVKLVDRIPFGENEEFAWIVETTEAAPLEVQLCWVDYPANAANQTAPRLVNDLDLTVRPLDDPDGKVLYGNGGESEDRLNNMESVRIASAEPRRYLVTVNCETILHDHTEGGAAALYIRGAFDPEAVSTDYGRVRVRETGKLYMSLDKALAAAEGGETVEILEPVKLRATTVVSNAVTIIATNDMASVSPVTPVKGSQIVLADGANAFFTNVVFAGNGQLMVDVRTGGVIRVAGCADLGEIRLATEDSLRVDGILTAAILVDAPFAKGNGEVFGRLEDAAFGSTANYLLNKYDDEIGGESDGTTLRWKAGASVPDAAAAARIEPFEAASTNYRSLAVLFKYNSSGRAAVLKNTTYTNCLALAEDFMLYGTTADITISPTAESRFIVSGGTLTFSNLTFAGRSASTAFVTVDGGAFTLEKGAMLLGLNGNGEGDSLTQTTGAIAVEAGTVTMRPESAIRDCRNFSTETGGGAIWLYGSGCTLNLEGGRITQCWTYMEGGGGAVFALSPDADVNVSGPLAVFDNWSGAEGELSDDLGLLNVKLTVVDNLTAGYVGLSYVWNAPEEGDVFAVVAPELQGSVTDYTLASFVCEDVYSSGDVELEAAVSDDGTSLVWKERDTSARTEPDEEWDVARIVRGDVTNYYYFIDGSSGAFADVQDDETIELLQPTDIIEDVPVNCRVTLTLAYESFDFDVFRGANCGFVIGKDGDLTLDGVWVSGTEGSYGTKASEPLFFVRGGALTLTNGTEIAGVRGSVNRASGAIVVDAKGTFTMMEGTAIRDCRNAYESTIDETGVGAALLVDNGMAYLYGGEISGNRAYRAAGVFIGNDGAAYVRGELIVRDNCTVTGGEPSDFTVEDHGQLYLDGDLTRLATVGMEDGIKREGSLTNVFGSVSEAALEACGGIAGATNYVTSAAKFFRDDNPSIFGRVVTNETEALLVWSTAIEDGAYVDEDGTVYGAVSAARVTVPSAVPGLVYDGNAKTGVVATVEGYWLEGNVATNAGIYKALAYPKPGYLWTDGTAAAKEISWSIGKATYDMSGITFDDATFTYDGQPKNIFISGDLPAGVMTNYIGNGRVDIGWWEVHVKFTGDEKNYERILDMVAHITIKKGEDPEPQWEIVTYHPTKIAFKSIDRISDTEWTLVITNREPYCNYRLIWTDDLTKGFTSTGDWEHAVGPAATSTWTTNVITTGGAWFWRAEGADGTNMVLKTEE